MSLRRASIAAVVFLVLGVGARASTRHYRGVITHVSPDVFRRGQA